jgi:hypothetical protein
MKNFLLATLISSASLCTFSQPTLDFESWTGTGSNIEATGWVSENKAVIPPLLNNPQSVFQATAVADVHGGTKALEIRSVKMISNPAQGKLPDPIGLAATGELILVPASLKFGFANSGRPASVSFWYKYAPAAGGDVAGFFIALTKWNTTTNKRDTIANGLWSTTTAISAYASQSVTLTYYSTTTVPDSMALIFSSTNLFNPNYTLCMNCGKSGSTLWVDDISFAGWNGIKEQPSSEGVILFPNPAREHVNISVDALNDAFSVCTFDVAGRLVSTTTLTLSNSASNKKLGVINTSGFSTGLYSYSVLDKNGVALRAGKFSVVK